jgi:hypothetical protein
MTINNNNNNNKSFISTTEYTYMVGSSKYKTFMAFIAGIPTERWGGLYFLYTYLQFPYYTLSVGTSAEGGGGGSGYLSSLWDLIKGVHRLTAGRDDSCL